MRVEALRLISSATGIDVQPESRSRPRVVMSGGGVDLTEKSRDGWLASVWAEGSGVVMAEPTRHVPPWCVVPGAAPGRRADR